MLKAPGAVLCQNACGVVNEQKIICSHQCSPVCSMNKFRAHISIYIYIYMNIYVIYIIYYLYIHILQYFIIMATGIICICTVKKYFIIFTVIFDVIDYQNTIIRTLCTRSCLSCRTFNKNNKKNFNCTLLYDY